MSENMTKPSVFCHLIVLMVAFFFKSRSL